MHPRGKETSKPRMAEYKIAGRLRHKEISRPKQEEERTPKNATSENSKLGQLVKKRAVLEAPSI